VRKKNNNNKPNATTKSGRKRDLRRIRSTAKEGFKIRKVPGPGEESASIRHNKGTGTDWKQNIHGITWDFTVYDAQLSEFDAKTWSANKETAKKVVAELKKGYTVLEIERDGSGRDTRYRVRSVS